MSEKKRIKFNVCGLNLKYFLPFFIVVMVVTYGGFMPTVKIYSNDAGTYMATSFIHTWAFLMAIGGIFFWLGNTIPIVNNYLGGACLLPLFGASLMNYMGLIPEVLVNGAKVWMKGGFQDMYIALLLVGSILVMDRKVLLSATARYMPAILGSQVFALGACIGGAITTLPALYTSLAGSDMTGLAGQFLCYASIANVLAVLFAAIGGAITEKIPGWNGRGKILRVESGTAEEAVKEEKRPGTSANYASLGSGIFMSLCFYLAGNVLGSLPVFNNIAGLAWTIILAIIVKCTGIIPDEFADNCVYSMNFALKALLPMLIAGIGICSLNITDLTKFFSLGVLVVIVLGAFIGAMIFGRLAGLYPYEAGITAGLCCCNIGGSGDIAVLTAGNRMNLLAFASISTRIGGALMVIWIGLLYPLFMH